MTSIKDIKLNRYAKTTPKNVDEVKKEEVEVANSKMDEVAIYDVKLNRYVRTLQCCGKCCCCIPTPCCSRYIKDVFKIVDVVLKLFLATFMQQMVLMQKVIIYY